MMEAEIAAAGDASTRSDTPRMYQVQEKLMSPLKCDERAKFVALVSRLVGLHSGQDRYPS